MEELLTDLISDAETFHANGHTEAMQGNWGPAANWLGAAAISYQGAAEVAAQNMPAHERITPLDSEAYDLRLKGYSNSVAAIAARAQAGHLSGNQADIDQAFAEANALQLELAALTDQGIPLTHLQEAMEQIVHAVTTGDWPIPRIFSNL
jgi:hypothetical protein